MLKLYNLFFKILPFLFLLNMTLTNYFSWQAINEVLELKRQIALLEVSLVGNDVPAIVCNQEFYGKVFLRVFAFGIVILLIYYFSSSGPSLDIALMGDKSLNGMEVFIIPTVNVSADSLVAKTTPYIFARISDAEFRESLRVKRPFKYFEEYFAERTYTADYIPPHVPGWFNG